MESNGNEVTRAEFEDLKRRMSEAEDRLHKGDITLALIDKSLGDISVKLGELTVWVQQLKEKPAKRWEAVVTQILNWAVALLLGYIALQMKLS